MGNVVLDISMSLDGFVAAPNDNHDQTLGDDGSRLHDWFFSGTRPSTYSDFLRPSEGSREVVDEMMRTTGAVITGRRTFDLVDGWGGDHPMHVPFFVLTHRPPESVAERESRGTFVTDGIESALARARAVAGDRNVILLGADTAQQYIKAGLLDEIQLHIVPMLLGGGIHLFERLSDGHVELERIRVVATPEVTHVRFRVIR